MARKVTLKKEQGTFAVHRDGDLCGIGLTKEQAETLVSESSVAYPSTVFSIVPGGEVVPGNREKK